MNFFLKIKKLIKNPTIRATSVISGTTIGVGVFGLPYVFQYTGILAAFSISILIFIFIFFLQYIYSFICIEGGKHRLIYYVKKFLGKKFEIIPFFSTLIGGILTLIAYGILGGKFLANIFNLQNTEIFQAIYIILGLLFIYYGIKPISFFDLIFIIFIFLGSIFIFLLNLNKINFMDYNFFNIDFSQIFLMYGVFTFSMVGFASIPEAMEILSKNNLKSKNKITVFWGSFIPYIFYLIFVIFIIGLSKGTPSQDSLSNISINKIIFIFYIFGFFATFSSFISIGSYIFKVLNFDLNTKKNFSIVLMFIFILFPVILKFFSNYLTIVGFIGGVFLAIEALLIIFIYFKNKEFFKKKYSFKISNIFLSFLIIFFILIIFYELYSFSR